MKWATILLAVAVAMAVKSAGRAANPADINEDGIVDPLDLAVLCGDWLAEEASGPADIDADGSVDMFDLALLCQNWRWTAPDPCEFAFIPGGAFQMGDSFNEGLASERPVHTVTLDSFYIGRYTVTNQQYRDFLASALAQDLVTITGGIVYKAASGTSYPYCDTSTSSSYSQIAYSDGVFTVRTKGGRSMADDPMVRVTWYGAAVYCNWRSEQEGREPCYNLSTWECDFGKRGYRLPTEAQWEYTARGGLSGKRFPWGDTITHSQANYYSSSSYSYDTSPTRGFHPTWKSGAEPYTSPVGSFPPNGYDLHDMAGNVWEWCNDWYLGTYYSSGPHINPTGPPTGSSRMLRGGTWRGDASVCRVAYRNYNDPSYRHYSYGLRLVLDP